MSAGKPKVEIPAWQRAAQPSPALADNPVYSQPHASQGRESEEDVREVAASSDETVEENGSASPAQSEEPAKQQQQQQYIFGAEDFDTFKQRQVQQNTPQSPSPSQPQQQQQQQQRAAAPPIITYPEFLVEAHKPPPLITPSRVLNTLYAAGGLATLLYAASKYIVNPMVDTLSESRHDFLSHSQAKVDQLNDRLSQRVSKQPGAKSVTSDIQDDTDSETSDPTELYHRDMGTQTEVPPEPRSILAKSEEKKDHVEWATNGLKIIASHITEMADGSDKSGELHKDRLEMMDNLRHYLDQLVYGTVGGTMWMEESIKNAYGNGAMGGGATEGSKEHDAIEELKKEIRGVKGVLLSAKRFPPVGRPIQSPA